MNVYDLAGIDFGLPPGLGLSIARQRPQSYQPPEQTESLLRQAMGVGVGGITQVANLLDTLRGPINTALAGRWEDVLPSIIDPSLRASGRDVLESWGALDQNRAGFHPWDDPADALGDVAGFGFEVATDPLTYMTFGGSALGKAGKVAKNAGLLEELARIAPTMGRREARLTSTLDDLLSPRMGEAAADTLARTTRAQDAAAGLGYNLDELTDQRLGGLVGTPFGAFGTGETAQSVARGLDTVGSWLRYGNIPGTNISPGRTLGALFSAEAGDASSRFGQETLMPELHQARDAARGEARGSVAEAAGNLVRGPDALRAGTFDSKRAARRLLEGIDPADNATRPLVDSVRKANDDYIREAAEWGSNRNLNDPEAAYLGRYMSGLEEKVPEGAAPRVAAPFNPSKLGRKEFTVGIKGGTDTLMRLASDADVLAIHGSNLTKKQKAVEIAKVIRAKFPEVPDQYAPRKLQVKGQPPVMVDRVTDLSRWITKMKTKTLQEGIYGNEPIADFAMSHLRGMDRLAADKTILQTLGDRELVKKMWAQTSTPGEGKTLNQLLGNPKEGGLGLNRKAAFNKILELRGIPQATLKQRKALGQELVPKDLADDITRYVKGFDGPDAAKGLVKVLDTFNAMFKTGVTTVFPAFHARNVVSGAFNNWVKGIFSPTAVSEAKKIIEGGAVDLTDIPIVKRMLKDRGLPLTPEASTDLMRELAYASEAATRHVDQSRGIQSIEDVTGQFVGGYAGSAPFSPLQSLGKVVGKGKDVNLNPLDIRGVGDRTKSGFGPAAAGEDFAYAGDALNRLSGFIAGLRKGMDPNKISEIVDAAQVGYQSRNYTAFERDVMTRAFPFYKYSRNALPFMVEELTERPGGKLAQFLRAQSGARGEEPGTPDYIRETASIGLGEQEDGSDRYITGFGLGYEDPLSFAGGGVRGGLLELASRANPLIKGPVEWATGESFFQKGPLGGREIDDLDPTLGRTAANIMYQLGLREDPSGPPVQILGDRTLSQGAEFAAANSPLARLFSTARTVSDPRKLYDVQTGEADPLGFLNLASGVRVADISPAAQDKVIQERADALMQEMGAKTFTETYFPDEAVAAMGPEDQGRAMQFEALQKLLDQRRKERRQQRMLQAGGI